MESQPVYRGEIAEPQDTSRFVLERLRQNIRPEDLPVGQNRENILALMLSEMAFETGEGVILIQGQTGSGKSVLLPGMLREALAQRNLPPNILVVQPRRDAALNTSQAVAAVEGLSWGKDGIVGCSTSETAEVGKISEIPVVTTGVALRYLSDWLKRSEDSRFVQHFGAILVDEFHENSIEYHLILGILTLLRERGKAPFIALTSATLDKEKIQDYFGMTDEQYLKVDGRSHPVENRYARKEEIAGRSAHDNQHDYIGRAALEARSLLQETREGDILVFMPGIKEIQATIRAIGTAPGVKVLALHGALSAEERAQALAPPASPDTRRVIVSTNIAETSLTLPGIVAVVDSCRSNSVSFNESTGIYEKTTDLISQNSAEQRAGRAGRVRPGICSRLITDAQWDNMSRHTAPEITRSNLAHVVLRLRGMNIVPSEFPFIDKPDPARLEEAERFLIRLGALDEQGVLTPHVGRRMLDMPFFEPALARMVVESERYGCVEATLILAILEREPHLFYKPLPSEIHQRSSDMLALQRYTVTSDHPPRVMKDGSELDSYESNTLLRVVSLLLSTTIVSA